MTDEALPSRDDPWGYLNRRVVVTGAASGMGAAACEILVHLGAAVVGVDVQDINTTGLAETHAVDLSDPTAIDATAAAIAAGGAVDALFNIAGTPGTADARTILAINFCGLHRLTEALIPLMPPGSAICSVGSTAAVNWP